MHALNIGSEYDGYWLEFSYGTKWGDDRRSAVTSCCMFPIFFLFLVHFSNSGTMLWVQGDGWKTSRGDGQNGWFPSPAEVFWMKALALRAGPAQLPIHRQSRALSQLLEIGYENCFRYVSDHYPWQQIMIIQTKRCMMDVDSRSRGDLVAVQKALGQAGLNPFALRGVVHQMCSAWKLPDVNTDCASTFTCFHSSPELSGDSTLFCWFQDTLL